MINASHFLSMLTLYIKLYICIYVTVCIYVYVGSMYGTRLQMKEETFFWWSQPSPIDIVNRNSGGKGSKKRSGIL